MLSSCIVQNVVFKYLPGRANFFALFLFSKFFIGTELYCYLNHYKSIISYSYLVNKRVGFNKREELADCFVYYMKNNG